jgi:capsular polysaccharide biosynthesis protein
VWLVGPYATPVTRDGRVLTTPFRGELGIMSLEAHDDVASFIAAGHHRRWPDDAEDRCVLSLVSRLETNYYHWTVDQLAQLQALERWKRGHPSVQPEILVSDTGPAFRTAMLEHLGVLPVTRWKGGRLAVRRLLVASIPGNRIAASPRSLQWLRERMLTNAGVEPHTGSDAGRRLYVGRAPGGWRSIVNANEVESALEDVGFDVVRPERLSFVEQVRLFAGASSIVGQHGAGLTNCLYAPRASVVELIGTYGGAEYYSICASLGLPYRAVVCDTRGDDIVVPVPDLLAAVSGRSTEPTAAR